MAEKPASPFVGLDKALMRSTRAQSASPDESVRVESPTDQDTLVATDEETVELTAHTAAKPAKQPSHSETKTPRNHATVIPRYQGDMVNAIRRAVRVVGKEAATYRYSPEEKARIADIIYTYKRHGLRTSENEISRIALNFVFQDYEENGEESILAKVLEALNR